MKLTRLISANVITLLATLALPMQCLAQGNTHKLPRYTVTDLGTLGGTFSLAGGLSDNGWVSGQSTLPNGDQHPALWRDGVMTDIGTLGGPNGWAGWRPNNRGEAGGAVEIAIADPNGEDYCGFGTYLECRPFLWRHSAITALPTLGGNNGDSAGVNNRGQVVGGAENTMIDLTCVPPKGFYQVKPVVWENGKVRELPTLDGDTHSWALAINDSGQMAGESGNCTAFTIHALLWQDGRVINLGNLGGTMNNLAVDINNQGQVVGSSNLAGDTTGHGFLWQWHTGMIDLGTLPGDVGSDADGINNLGQVVGGSWDAEGNESAYVWEGGTMTDLNTLIPRDSPLHLIEATGTINDWGQIAGIALQISTGDIHAFLATPTKMDWEIGERSKVVLPKNVLDLLHQQRHGNHFQHKLAMPQ